MSDRDRMCWECKTQPRRKRALFFDTRCADCGAKYDAMSPEEKQQHNVAVFDRNIAAVDGGMTGPELRGMIADVAKDELKKLRASRG